VPKIGTRPSARKAAAEHGILFMSVYGISLFYRGMIAVSAPEISLPDYAKVMRLLFEFRITNDSPRVPALV
jgi:hypothetical protein